MTHATTDDQMCTPLERSRVHSSPTQILTVMVLYKTLSGVKTLHYRSLYPDRQDPILVIPWALTVNTIIFYPVLYDDFCTTFSCTLIEMPVLWSENYLIGI